MTYPSKVLVLYSAHVRIFFPLSETRLNASGNFFNMSCQIQRLLTAVYFNHQYVLKMQLQQEELN